MTTKNSINEMLADNHKPSTLVFITTYKCTASCKNCCFGCTPKQPLGVDARRMLALIDSVAKEFPSVKIAVFTGGECFLLGKSLDKLVSHAKSKGLLTRCVTNGFWARTPAIAAKRIGELQAAGLTEINFSAGFAHQEFVPSESVLNGAISAAKSGMLAIVSVENSTAGEKGGEALSKHPLMVQFRKEYPEKAGLISILDTVWVGEGSFGDNGRSRRRPCDNIMDSLVIMPDLKLKSCCGLSVNSIPEMNMGNVSPLNIRAKHAEQFDDFLKIWIKVDGPEGIIEYVKGKCPGIDTPKFSHPCQACKFLYATPEIRSYIREHFQEKVADVLFRFSAVKEVTGRVNKLIGYGA
jgi:hypothetical protein